MFTELHTSNQEVETHFIMFPKKRKTFYFYDIMTTCTNIQIYIHKEKEERIFQNNFRDVA